MSSHDALNTRGRHLRAPLEETLLTVAEVAAVLRTSPKGIYTMVERGPLPGVVRIGRRVLVQRRELLDWLDHNCAPSPKE